MIERPLAVIAPHLPPAVCGIGDHTARLLAAFTPGRPLAFLVPEAAPDGQLAPSEFLGQPVRTFAFKRASLEGELNRIGECDVFVQYSGYGFHPRGSPSWLVEALLAWRQRGWGRLLVFFHELWGEISWRNSNAPWEWLHRGAVLRLASGADAVFTNIPDHVARLRAHLPGFQAALAPVGSNVTPPADPGDSQAPGRRGVFALFGRPGTRWRVLRALREDLAALAAAGRAHRVLIAGGGSAADAAAEDDLLPKGLAVEHHGFLGDAALSALLLRAELGLTDDVVVNWGKSTVFAIYAAHGLGILTQRGGEDGTEPAASCVRSAELRSVHPPGEEELRARAARLLAWFRREAAWPALAVRLGPALGLAPAARTRSLPDV